MALSYRASMMKWATAGSAGQAASPLYKVTQTLGKTSAVHFRKLVSQEASIAGSGHGQAKCVQILYTEGVEAHWIEATIVERGKLILEDLPFAAGQAVEVLVLPGRAPSACGQIKTLRDSVLEYRDPFDPVASEDWEAQR
jgi:hypothetical protein